VDSKVPVFSFTMGIPKPNWIAAFKKNSTLLIGTATNVKEAQALEAANVDAVCTQSSEAGGHRGTFIGPYEHSMIGGLALIPQVVDAVKVPVIAAGGIMDGRGIAAALALGAQAVQLGTAFLTVNESPAHAVYKKQIRERDAGDTTITKVFSGGAARGFENDYIAANTDKPLLPFPFHNALTRSFRNVANAAGQIEYTNLWSGQNGRLARQIAIQELVTALMTETEDVLTRLSGLKLSQ
jgi:nitronate monooxygenase